MRSEMVVCHLYAVLPSHAHVNKPILLIDTFEVPRCSLGVSLNLQFHFKLRLFRYYNIHL